MVYRFGNRDGLNNFSIVQTLIPDTFTGELRVTALTEVQIFYLMLNNTPGISTPIYDNGKIIGQKE